MDVASEKDNLERWARTWREAQVALSEQKRSELARIETPFALSQLADAFEHARLHHIPTDTSGLVEQQRFFQQLQQ